MSILDGQFSSREQMEGSLAFAQTMLAEALPNLDKRSRDLIEATQDGSSLGDVLGITKEQKQAILDLGCRLIQAGDLDKATDALLQLSFLDPLEERAMYAMGVICQLRGDLRKAAQMYMQFLALDATNPMGYLRLGECLMAAREYGEARSAFEMAKDLAADGKGQPGNREEAERMLSLPEIAAANTNTKQ